MTTNCRLLCFAPYAGAYSVHHQLDLVFSLGVRLKGGETLTIGCNQLFTECEVTMHSSDKGIDCAQCAFKGRQFLEYDILPFVPINHYVTAEEIAQADGWSKTQIPSEWERAVYNGDPLGAWCLSSVYTRFQISGIDSYPAEGLSFYQNTLRNAALTVIAVKRVLADFRPTVAIVFNARFAQYRTAFEILRQHGIRVIVHERGLADNTFLFFENTTVVESQEYFRINDLWRDTPLRTAELERVKEYLTLREFGKDLNTQTYMTIVGDANSVRKKLCVGREHLLGLFTSTEAEMAENKNAVNVQARVLELMFTLMKEFPDTTLVIRHHPNLYGGTVHPPEYRFITQLYRLMIDAPRNVRVVMPSEQLSTYSLMWNIEGAVTPFSTVGIEVQHRGNASMTSAHFPFSRGQTATFTEVDLEQFRTGIRSVIDRSKDFDVEVLRKVYRFIYTLVARLSIRFQSIGIKNIYERDLSPTIVEDLTKESDPHLTRIINGLVQNTLIYPAPGEVDRDRSLEEENVFLESEVRRITTEKRQVYDTATKEPHVFPPVCLVSSRIRSSIYPKSFCERYSDLREVEIDSDGSDNECLLRLQHASQGCTAQYIAFLHPQMSFDGNFISSGTEVLHENNLDKKMLLRGVWISDHTGEISTEFLSKYNRSFDSQAIHRAFSTEVSITTLLSLGFYRTEYFRDLIATLLNLSSPAERIAKLHAIWTSETTHIEYLQCGIYARLRA